MNILSLGASFGAMVWIFQEGHLSGPLGFTSVGALDLWMPVLILIFAFGLSMDYEVFLLSRIKEVHDETGDNDLPSPSASSAPDGSSPSRRPHRGGVRRLRRRRGAGHQAAGRRPGDRRHRRRHPRPHLLAEVPRPLRPPRGPLRPHRCGHRRDRDGHRHRHRHRHDHHHRHRHHHHHHELSTERVAVQDCRKFDPTGVDVASAAPRATTTSWCRRATDEPARGVRDRPGGEPRGDPARWPRARRSWR